MRISLFDSSLETNEFLKRQVAEASELDCIVVHSIEAKKIDTLKNELQKHPKLSIDTVNSSFKLTSGNCFLISQQLDYQIINDELIVREKDGDKSVEEQLIAERNKYKRIANALDKSALVSITNRAGIITYANESFREVSKYTKEELIGNSHSIVNSGYHLKSFWKGMWETITSGKVWRNDVKNEAKDGSYYWVDTVINPILDETGQIASFMSIRYLITDKKELKEQNKQKYKELKKITEKFELSLKATHYGHWDVDLENLEITYSDRYFEILGVKPHSSFNRSDFWKQLLHPEDKDAILILVHDAINGKQSTYTVESRMKHADGHYVPVLVHGLITRKKNGKATRVTGTLMDLTEWKKKEKEIQTLNNNHLELVNSLHGIVWEAEIDTADFTFVSQQAETILGYKTEDWLSHPNFWTDHMHPDDRKWAASYSRQQAKDLKSHKLEYRMFHKNGDIKWIEDIVTVINENNSGVKLRGIMIDITEKKIAEEALKESENNLRFIAENTSDGIAIYENNHISYSTEAYNQILGHSYEDNKNLSLESISKLLHPEDKEYVFSKAEAAIKAKNPVVFYEYRIKKQDGNYTWREDTINLVYNNEGAHVKSVIVARDITERKYAENALKESEAKHQYIVENSKELVCIHEPDGRYKYVSPACQNLLGYEPEELVGKDAYSFFHPTDIERIRKTAHEPMLDNGETANVQYRFRKKDGDYVWFDTYTEAITDENNNITSLITGSRDISSLKEVEIDLLVSERKFKGLANNVLGTIYLCENNERYSMIYINEKITALTGYTPAEFINNEINFIDLCHPEDKARILKNASEKLKQNQPFTMTYRLIDRFGNIKWVEEHGVGINDGNNQLVEGIVLDVTKSKTTERALQESEEMLLNIANSIPGVILRYKIYDTSEDEVDFVSKGVETLWEIPHEELANDVRKLWDKIHPEDLSKMSTTINESAETLNTWRCEYRLLFPDGRIKWISAIGEPKKSDDGTLIWHTLCLDVTEKKNFEQELKQTLAQFDLAIETAELGIWEQDLKTKKLDWNKNMFNIFDVEESSFNGDFSEFSDRVYPEDSAGAGEGISRMLKGETVRDIRFRIKTDIGITKHIYASGAPVLNEKGETVKLMGINIDFSRVAQYQEKLERTINEKEALFRELHHRIKNNLQIVSSILFIKSEYSQDKKLQNFINETTLRINSISKIHEQLLQLEGIDELDIKLYLEGLIQEILKTFHSSQKTYFLNQDIDSSILNVDTALNIGLIVNEILSNCIKYAYPNSDGGPISITLKKNQSSLLLSIEDEGVGIPEEILSNKSQSHGLSLIELFTDQINGKLSVKNGVGTSFEIKLPV